MVPANSKLRRAFAVWLATGKTPANLYAFAKSLPAPLKHTATMPTRTGIDWCVRLGLLGPPEYLSLPYEEIDDVWNGMGPDPWNAHIRELIDKVASCVFLCSLPHDMWFSKRYNDGTRRTYEMVDAQWRDNSGKLVERANSGANWITRSYNMFAAQVVHDALVVGAWQAWQDAHERNINGFANQAYI